MFWVAKYIGMGTKAKIWTVSFLKMGCISQRISEKIMTLLPVKLILLLFSVRQPVMVCGATASFIVKICVDNFLKSSIQFHGEVNILTVCLCSIFSAFAQIFLEK
jgi:hypothetical protein